MFFASKASNITSPVLPSICKSFVTIVLISFVLPVVISIFNESQFVFDNSISPVVVSISNNLQVVFNILISPVVASILVLPNVEFSNFKSPVDNSISILFLTID